jgi:hypothetical protein
MTYPFVPTSIEILLFLSGHDLFVTLLIRHTHGILTEYRNRITASCDGFISLYQDVNLRHQ